MLRERASTAVVVAVVLALVISPIAGIVEPADAQSEPDIKTYAATENVSVWERAAFPFRLETDDAAKSVRNGGLDVAYTEENTGDISARKPKLAVYSTGDTVDAKLASGVDGAGTTDLKDTDTKLVVARMEPSQSNTDSLDLLPTSVGEIKNFFDTEDANQNASFRTIDTGKTSGTGTLDADVKFDKAGAYALFLTTGDAVSADKSGDISISGETTIIGMDTAVVEEKPADVTNKPTSVVDGNSASFTVNTPTDEKTNVSVALYDTSKWINSYTVVRLTEKINTDLSGDDFTIKHSISEVNGEAELADPYSMFGVDIGPASRAGSFSASSVIQFLTEEADDRTDRSVTKPNTDATDDTVMDASMVTKVEQEGPVTVDLQTYENWSTGQYTWVVVTGGNDAGDIQTATSTLNVKESSGGGGGGGGGFTPSPPDDDDDDDDDGDDVDGPGTPPGEEEDRPADVRGAGQGSSVTEDRGAARVNITNTSPGANVTVDLPTNETEVERNGVGLTQMQFNTTTNTSANMTVRSQSESTNQVSDSDLGYIEIDEEISPDSVSSATYTFSVTQQRIEERGVAPENVALFRLEDSGWNELQTTLIDNTSTSYTYRAKSPGLSLYAISQKGSAQANIDVTDASVDPTSVEVAEPIEVTATIENTGNAQGSFEPTLEIDGEAITSQSVTVAAGETTTVTFEYSFDNAGERTVSVSGVTAGTVDVSPETGDTTTTTTQPPTTTTAPSTSTTSTGDGGSGGLIPGFGIGVALIGLLAAALIALRD